MRQPTELAERLRTVRGSLGLSQKDAACKAGMKSQQLSDLERGRIKSPSLDTLARLAAAYNMGVDELIGRGQAHRPDEIPEGLAQLMGDPEWGSEITGEWVETLLAVRYCGRGLGSKREFLEAFLTLRRLLA